jgi:hypothetical protein
MSFRMIPYPPLQMSTELQYSPLNREKKEIRLLQFDTTDSLDGLIRAQLIHAPLNDRLDYYALSYTWGSSERTRSISLSGHDFPVTENLYQALHSFRRFRSDPEGKKNERYWYIWIDAISINQNDVAERNYEVTRMTDIYRFTAHVYIWLGVASQDSALAIEHLGNLAEHATWNKKVTILQRATNFLKGCLLRVVALCSACFYTLLRPLTLQFFVFILTQNSGYGLKGIPVLSYLQPFRYFLTRLVFAAVAIKATRLVVTTYWTNVSKLTDELYHKPKVEVAQALQSFFQRPWFYRVWIIQEVSMARRATIFCGDDVIAWDTFCIACRQIQHIVDRTSERSLYLDTHHRNATGLQLYSRATPTDIWRGQAKGPQRDLLSLLIQYSFFGATNQRDKIYSLVGLAKDCDFAESDASSLSPPKPDYDKPVSQVYAEWMRYMILKSNSLAVLELCDGICEMPGLSSWVPDFSQRLVRDRLEERTEAIAKFPHIPIATFSSNLQTLTVRGFTIGHLDGDMRIWSTTTGNLQYRLRGNTSPTSGPVDMSFLLKIIRPIAVIMSKVFFAPIPWNSIRKFCYWCIRRAFQHENDNNPRSGKLRSEVEALIRGLEDFLADWDISNSQFRNKDMPSAFVNVLGDEFPDVLHLSVKSLGWKSTPGRILKPMNRCTTVAHDPQQGDAICLLVGSRQPALLRKKGDHYHFVGMLMPWTHFTYALWIEYEEGYKSGRLQMETFELR